MTPQEFAEKYAGYRLKIRDDSDIPYRNEERIIIGYTEDKTQVIVKRAHGGGRGDPAIAGHFITAPKYINDKITWVRANHQDYDLIDPPLPSPLPPLYASTCTSCQSPTRKCAGFVLCSNVKCKTRKKFNKIVASYPKLKVELPFNGTKENPIDVICAICGTLGSDVRSTKVMALNCPNCNKWTQFKFVIGKWYRYKYAYKDKYRIVRFDDIGRWMPIEEAL